MQYRLETPAQRDLRHLLDASDHDAWLAYRRAKYGPDAPDLCCDPHQGIPYPMMAVGCNLEQAEALEFMQTATEAEFIERYGPFPTFNPADFPGLPELADEIPEAA